MSDVERRPGRTPAKPNDPASTGLARTHFWIPLSIFAAAIAIIAYAHLDVRIARALYDLQGHRWALRNAFATETLIHLTGRAISASALICTIVAWIVAMRRTSLAHWRKPLGYLSLSVLLPAMAVAWIKSWSHMDCPWDIQDLGGIRPYISLYTARPAWMPAAGCFPAGHAVGGYGWMSLYFFFLMTRPRLRWYGLSIGIALGLLFGIAQQMRGAHFFSHDVWTAAICWFIGYGLYRLFGRRARRDAEFKVGAIEPDSGPSLKRTPTT